MLFLTGLFLSLLVLLLCMNDAHSEDVQISCSHSRLLSDHPELLEVPAYSIPRTKNDRRLAHEEYAPIRIHPIYLELDTSPLVTSEVQELLKDRLIPDVLHRISQLFSVRPVQEPLFQHTPCPDTASNTNVGAFLEPHTDRGSTSTPHSCSPPPYNPRTCAITPGIPPLTLPPETGFPDTDLVVYVTATQSGPCVPYLSNAPSSDTNTEKEAQPASDSKVNTGRRLSTTSRKGTYAFATTCMREDAGRPILGRINFCPESLASNSTQYQTLYRVAIHELFHVLGFSSSSWFRYPTNQSLPMPNPLLHPRLNAESNAQVNRRAQEQSGLQTVDNRSPPPIVVGSCVNKTNVLPHSDVLQFLPEFGSQCDSRDPRSVPPYVHPSLCTHFITTPNARAAARYHFGCPTVPGVQLENYITGENCILTGSHLEQKMYHLDLMASVVQPNAKITSVSLAVLEDSGWYKANYTAADELVPFRDFGYKQGCAFAHASCYAHEFGGFPAHWHADARNRSYAERSATCTPDLAAIGYAVVQHYPLYPSGASVIPTHQRYFDDVGVLGGHLFAADFCPVVTAYANGVCNVASNAPAERFDVYGETFGPESACAESTLAHSQATPGSIVPTPIGAGCFAMRCYKQPGQPSGKIEVHVTVPMAPGMPSPSDGSTIVYPDFVVHHNATHMTLACTRSHQILRNVPGYSGTFTCPNILTLCGPPEYAYMPFVPPANKQPAPRKPASIQERFPSKLTLFFLALLPHPPVSPLSSGSATDSITPTPPSAPSLIPHEVYQAFVSELLHRFLLPPFNTTIDTPDVATPPNIRNITMNPFYTTLIDLPYNPTQSHHGDGKVPRKVQHKTFRDQFQEHFRGSGPQNERVKVLLPRSDVYSLSSWLDSNELRTPLDLDSNWNTPGSILTPVSPYSELVQVAVATDVILLHMDLGNMPYSPKFETAGEVTIQSMDEFWQDQIAQLLLHISGSSGIADVTEEAQIRGDYFPDTKRVYCDWIVEEFSNTKAPLPDINQQKHTSGSKASESSSAVWDTTPPLSYEECMAAEYLPIFWEQPYRGLHHVYPPLVPLSKNDFPPQSPFATSNSPCDPPYAYFTRPTLCLFPNTHTAAVGSLLASLLTWSVLVVVLIAYAVGYFPSQAKLLTPEDESSGPAVPVATESDNVVIPVTSTYSDIVSGSTPDISPATTPNTATAAAPVSSAAFGTSDRVARPKKDRKKRRNDRDRDAAEL